MKLLKNIPNEMYYNKIYFNNKESINDDSKNVDKNFPVIYSQTNRNRPISGVSKSSKNPNYTAKSQITLVSNSKTDNGKIIF